MIVRKTLSPNDVGRTGSHQAGIAVPKALARSFFPTLDSRLRNPDLWLDFIDDSGTEWRWRYIYYNSRLFGSGTRNEYRLTHIRPFLSGAGAKPGEQLELEKLQDGRFRARIVGSAQSARGDANEIVIDLRGGWRSVTVARRR